MLWLGVVFAVSMLLGAILQVVLQSVFGNWAHQIGDRYVVRYYFDGGVLQIYRDSDYWIEFSPPEWISTSLLFTGIYCLTAAFIEAVICFFERRNQSRIGFDIVNPHPKPNDPQ